MAFNFSNLRISPEQVLRAAGIIPRESSEATSQELEEVFEGDAEVQQGSYLSMTKQVLGIVQAKPRAEQDIFCHEFGARYLPKLAEAFRENNAPNNAAMVIINVISASHYFVRFLYSPAGSDILQLQAQRMVTERMLSYEDEHNSVAEVCQFLSTLLVLSDTETIPLEVRGPLLQKLKAWKAQFRGRFAQETAERCIFMLEPSLSQDAFEMGAMRVMMRQMLTKGVLSCKYKNCNSTSQSEGAELMRCSNIDARHDTVASNTNVLTGQLINLCVSNRHSRDIVTTSDNKLNYLEENCSGISISVAIYKNI